MHSVLALIQVLQERSHASQVLMTAAFPKKPGLVHGTQVWVAKSKYVGSAQLVQEVDVPKQVTQDELQVPQVWMPAGALIY